MEAVRLDGDLPEPAQRLAQVRARFRQCPNCGQRDPEKLTITFPAPDCWLQATALIDIRRFQVAQPDSRGWAQGFSVTPTTCSECGYVMMFSTVALLGMENGA